VFVREKGATTGLEKRRAKTIFENFEKQSKVEMWKLTVFFFPKLALSRFSASFFFHRGI